ncbi:MAG: hypothetical protein DRN15_08180 [Thermoprotei archaeon]|nr:MAG: hypothetical protein DRM97_07180 [Thermoprotei archaeon]RLF22734.1 MAG: hypothetical protein DRN15_08180 [Thermoprotei archaeon]
MVDVEMVSRLRGIGFSEYEALAYAALVEIGEGTADTISKLSGIPLPRIYSVLDELARKGFVEVMGARPKRFILVNPSRAFDEYFERKRKEMESRLKRLKEACDEIKRMIEPLYLQLQLKIRPEALIEPLSGLSDAEERTKELIGRAKTEILILTRLFSWYFRVRDELRKAIERGVSVKVLMKTDISTLSIVEELKSMGAQVRRHPVDWYPVRGTIVDRSKAIFIIWAKSVARGVGYVYRPHYTENPGMIQLLCDVFDSYWSRGEKA